MIRPSITCHTWYTYCYWLKRFNICNKTTIFTTTRHVTCWCEFFAKPSQVSSFPTLLLILTMLVDIEVPQVKIRKVNPSFTTSNLSVTLLSLTCLMSLIFLSKIHTVFEVLPAPPSPPIIYQKWYVAPCPYLGT